ncbi:MAG TPA: YtxH domain-containing protein [Verrucomicrobiae bacterium]|nr:YtxH domain-containing protein [Verrucomicrobiae bacterium]
MAKEEKKEHAGRNMAIGAALAAGAGYVAGILTAPKSGKDTRKDIKDTAVKTKTEAEKRLKVMHSEATDLIGKAKTLAKNVGSGSKDELNQAIESAVSAREKARNLLSALHEGDADDKDLEEAIAEVNSAVEHLKKYVSKNVQQSKKA